MSESGPEVRAEDRLPNECSRWRGEHGVGGVIVYAKSEWSEYDELEDREDRFGWPFTRTGEKFFVDQVIWDPTTETVVVVVDDRVEHDAKSRNAARRQAELDRSIDNFADAYRETFPL